MWVPATSSHEEPVQYCRAAEIGGPVLDPVYRWTLPTRDADLEIHFQRVRSIHVGALPPGGIVGVAIEGAFRRASRFR